MKIQLTKGKYTEVDDADYDFLNQWKWWIGSDGYAVREQSLGTINGIYKRKTVLMHRLLMNPPIGQEVDHANRDRLDNRRSNLRLATRSQNMANKTVQKRRYNLPRGVTFNRTPRSKQPYTASVMKEGKRYFLGHFYDLESAVEAYRRKKVELFGEFA